MKQAAVGASLALLSLMSNAQLAQPNPAVAAAPTPAVVVAQPQQAMTVIPAGSATLEEISKLRAIKSRLEVEKDIAKLTFDINEIKNGKKSTGSAGPSAAGLQMPAFQAPSLAQMMSGTTSVTSIYGSGKNLTAEMTVGRTKVIAKNGTVLPSGEVVQSVHTDHVVLSQGKKMRSISPTSDSGVPYMAPSQQMASGPGNNMPTIQPFNPADLISPTPSMQSEAPVQGSQEDKKPDSM